MPTVNRGLYNWLFRGGAVLEDFADRLSHVWTFGLLLVCASIISWKQSYNDPIRCLIPPHLPSSTVAYAHATCWGSNYYYVPLAIDEHYDTKTLEVTGWLYKWLPLILVIQAILYKLPNIIMNMLHGYSGISFEMIAGFTQGFEKSNLDERKQLCSLTGCYFYNWCKQWPTFLPWRVLCILWLVVKILYLVNSIAQLVLVDAFLSTRNPPFDNSTSYGDAIYDNLLNSSSTQWKRSPALPQTVMCNFSVRHTAKIETHAVQCELPINEFTEYVYMIIWIWLLIVAVTSCLSLLTWLVLTVLPFPRQRYISKMLDLADYGLNKPTRTDTDRLASLVGEDGVMVLKLMSSNSSELFVRDVVSIMCQLSNPQSYFSYATAGPQSAEPLVTIVPGPCQAVTAPPGQCQTGAWGSPEKEHLE